MQTPSPGAFVTPSPAGCSHAVPPALPYRAPAPARAAMGSHAATPSTHPGPSPSQTEAGSNQRWKFMDDTGKLRKVSGRLFSEPSASLRFVPCWQGGVCLLLAVWTSMRKLSSQTACVEVVTRAAGEPVITRYQSASQGCGYCLQARLVHANECSVVH